VTLRSVAATATAFRLSPDEILQWPESKFRLWGGYAGVASSFHDLYLARAISGGVTEPTAAPEDDDPARGRANAERIMALIDSGSGPSRRRLERRLGKTEA